MKRDDRKKSVLDTEAEKWPEPQREWAKLAAGAMIFAGAPNEALAPVLDEVRESVAASGQTPSELFGEPVAFGRKRGKQSRPAAQILEGSLPFHSAAGAFTVMLASLGCLLLVLGIWIGFSDGWMARTFAGPVMLLFPLMFGLCGFAAWGWVLRTRGRLRAPLAIWVGTLAGFAGTVALMTALGGFEAPGPPNWAMPPIGIVLIVLAFKLPEPATRPLVDDSAWDDEHYFDHAENLLRGRYLFTKKQAVAALAESREHRQHPGAHGTAAADFGNVERFAAHLAAATRTPLKRGIILRRAGFSLIVVFFGITIISELIEGPTTAWLIIQSVMVLALAAYLVMAWRPSRISSDAKEVQAERRRTARLLADAEEK
ncbi:hypothetical protein [Paeniglutamicibacter gangotriensis]|uniref:Uncharacterized protein n=1 Tax=Paeniglutamicibacter gangotriensis Lz1y TaxID=1276920 RepID=M7MMR1_9MICC|nr:hypothetical protein [Paeniglutamicibacter gangotriensis]EMQ97642.1 hypothetical protein ADIAG_03022 [Paeniglutamicibacter gangotriensis Lz1y]